MKYTYYIFLIIIFSMSSCATTKTKDTHIAHFIDHGNGTVTDTKTKLMWKKCSEGSTGKNCSGTYFYFVDMKKQKVKWDKSNKKCRKYAGKICVDPGYPVERFHHLEVYKRYDKPTSYAGYNNWRLPTQKELISIRQCIPNPEKKEIRYNGEEYYLFFEPAINTDVFPNNGTDRYQATERENRRHSLTPAYVSYSNLCGEGFNRSSINAVRLVRNIN